MGLELGEVDLDQLVVLSTLVCLKPEVCVIGISNTREALENLRGTGQIPSPRSLQISC